MLCDDCRHLVQRADERFDADDNSAVIKQEVTTTEFIAAIEAKCYLCTRLHIELGDKKWNQLSSQLSTTNLVAFDKSAHCHPPDFILVRLGCKLTPTSVTTDAGEQTLEQTLGKGYSYGYLQVALLPSRFKFLEDPQSSEVHFQKKAAKDTTSTGDPKVLSLIRHWLDTCNKADGHETCRRRAEQVSAYPTRLIDVMPERLPRDSWRLVEAQKERITGPFVTLSHRWGSTTVKLERNTQEEMLRGMPVSGLPVTYQEAIKVVRHLGVRYLWIDSICIFQDERIDIQKEATRMAEVYGSAICNISALSGKDDGLFSTRSPEIVNSDAVLLDSVTFNMKQSYIINDLQLWRGELVHMPLTSRAWVLQEEVLAPRTIYFGARQVLWDCSDFRACETYPGMQKQQPAGLVLEGMNEKQLFLHDEEVEPISWCLKMAWRDFETTDMPMPPEEWRRQLFRGWNDFVAHYSLRQLTYAVDKLLAIAGVAKLFGRLMRDEFVAGLWRSRLMEGLLWYIRANTRTARPIDYRAPTWSWASNDGYVLYAEPFNASWIVARALEAECEVARDDPLTPPQQFGIVTSGRMRLQAPCVQMRLGGDGNWIGFSGKYQIPRLTVRLDATDSLPAGEDFVGAIIRTTSYRLTEAPSAGTNKILLAAQGIVLMKTGELAVTRDGLEEPAAIYMRIGYFALEDRKNGSLTPKWGPSVEGVAIFPRPVKQEEMGEFVFKGAEGVLSTLEVR